VRGRAELPRVDIAASYAGADGSAIRAFVGAGARAIVSASLPPGVTTPAETDALLEARGRGVAVVLSSRAGSGRVLPRALLRRQGFVVADNLTPQKARVLAICNTNGAQIPRESDAVLYTHAGPEVGVAATKTFLAQIAAGKKK